MWKRIIPSGFYQLHYDQARRKLRKTSFRNLLNYLDTYITDFAKEFSAYAHVNRSDQHIHLTEMKRIIAQMQAVVDELSDDET